MLTGLRGIRPWWRLAVLGAVAVGACTTPVAWAQPAPEVRPTPPAGANRDDPNFWRRRQEGWFWYADPAAEARPEAETPTRPAAREAPPPTQQELDLAAFERFKVDLERAMNAATQNPSEANVARFLELWAAARSKARAFSDAAEVLAVRMPWIDPTYSAGVRPMQPTAMRAWDMVAMQDRDQLLQEMSQSYGLYFFFRNNCAYCHVQAPLLRQFQQKYGFTVFAVTMDGGTLPQFPDAVRDDGMAARIAQALGIPEQYFVVPAVVLARPSTGEVVPVGFGAMTMDEMAGRIANVVRVRDNGPGRAATTTLQALTGVSDVARPADPVNPTFGGLDPLSTR